LAFGGKAAEVTEALGRWAGVRKDVAAHGVRTGCELAMKALADEHGKRGFTAASLGEFLAAQASSLRTFVPAPLFGVLGLLPAAAVARPETVSTLARMAQVLGVAAVFLGTMFFYRTCGVPKAQAAEPKRVEVKLPGGGSLRLIEGAFTYNLVRFLGDAADTKVPRTFVFDHLNFFTGETRITPESVPTVAELVTILKAYPDAEVRLEGHTDSQGDAAANQTLSEQRAAAIQSYLLTQGVAAARMSTAGFGQTKPMADNATEEGRAQNRRLELVVVRK
jgi:outer membrane protein OmpA-like peptidoglycan-associated protein